MVVFGSMVASVLVIINRRVTQNFTFLRKFCLFWENVAFFEQMLHFLRKFWGFFAPELFSESVFWKIGIGIGILKRSEPESKFLRICILPSLVSPYMGIAPDQPPTSGPGTTHYAREMWEIGMITQGEQGARNDCTIIATIAHSIFFKF